MNIKAEETTDVDEHVWVGAGDDPRPSGWPAAPTSSPGGST